jgi:anti-sigma factor RsiW
VKCSLLSLSTLIDGELAPERRAEVEAHLVGCPRCTTGTATLGEEKVRVGQLARVEVDPVSAKMMLEQVGIVVESFVPRAHVAPPALPSGSQLPWQQAVGSAALPWKPVRPASIPSANEGVTVPAFSADAQPDLPFEGATAVAPEADEGWAGSTAEQAWEAHVPPPVEPVHEAVEAWEAPSDPVPVSPPPVPALPPVLPPVHPQVPTRVPAASGPAGLWSRLRDAMAVRLALSHGADKLEDSAQIVLGASPRRGAELPAPPPPAAVTAEAAAAPRVAAEAARPSSVELMGTRGVGLPAHPAHDARVAGGVDVEDRVVRRPETGWPVLPRDRKQDGAAQGSGEAEGWHAFAASSYPIEQSDVEPAPAAPHRPLGRHSRAVTREQVGLVTRVSGALAVAATATRARAAAVAGSVRGRIGSISSAGPDSRILAGIAGIGLIFVLALLIGHASSSARSTATRSASSSAATITQPQHSAPARSSPAQSSAAASAGAAAGIQSYGSGATGFQVSRLRYGQQATFMRVVLDLGPGAGTPRVTVAFSDPKTVVVTLDGTAPATSVSAPPVRSIISSVTLVSGNAHITVYRIALKHAATTTAFFLLSPTRFVLDLH